jgi:acetyl coenzyme A synthetase (ADP forming)-like protein
MDLMAAGSIAVADVVLRDGSTLHVRPVGPEDASSIDELRRSLATTSQTANWTADGGWPGDLASIPASEGAALVGEVAGRVHAVAGFRRADGSGDRADVLLAVSPGLTGRGIGTRLLEMLARAARPAGIEWFHARLPRDDRALLDLFTASGFDVEQHLDGGRVEVQVALRTTPAFLERSAARAQQAAAASMRAFLEPQSVAVVGASRSRGKIGTEILRNLIQTGFTGRIHPIHPEAATLEGLEAVARLADVPGDVDLAVVVVPAADVPAVVDDCIAKRVPAILVISAGFAETGAAGRARETELLEKVRRAGVRLVGPNCMGLLNTDPAIRLNATFAPVYPPDGRVAMSTQSGALGMAILDHARRLQLGISSFVSIGNKADVSTNDLIQYWAEDPRTTVIVLYLESFGNPRKFGEIARRVGRDKPIVAVKAGRSAAGARAATSHTGALAASDAIVDALFRQAGVVRTSTLEELFDVARLLAQQPVPRGRRVAIVTNAGGPGILAADVCEAQGLELPALSEPTVAHLRSFLPAAAAVGNPVDMIASASADQFGRTLTAVLADDRVDSALVIFIPPLVTAADEVARAVREAAATRPGKPVLAIFMSTSEIGTLLAPIPAFTFPEAAAMALARAATYGAWRATPPGRVPAYPDVDRDAMRRIIDAALARGGGWLAPDEAHALLGAAGIPAAAGRVATTEDAAVEAAEAIGYPVAAKVVGPDIIHKTEVRGVQLDLRTADDVRKAWRDFAGRLGAAMTGMAVQEFVTGGVEMLAGATEDPTFGPVLACATGGVLTELLKDAEFRLHPLTDRDAASMVASLRGAALLRGLRGAPPADVRALEDALLRLSALIAECPEIPDIEINPLVVLPRGLKAVDVRARVEPPRPPVRTRRVTY